MLQIELLFGRVDDDVTYGVSCALIGRIFTSIPRPESRYRGAGLEGAVQGSIG
jgi:hypothetical protein